jgi:hypothetical protein
MVEPVSLEEMVLLSSVYVPQDGPVICVIILIATTDVGQLDYFLNMQMYRLII